MVHKEKERRESPLPGFSLFLRQAASASPAFQFFYEEASKTFIMLSVGKSSPYIIGSNSKNDSKDGNYMFNKEFATLVAAISPERAFHNLCEIATHHRIQASPGYREAAVQCAKYLNAQGIPSRILTYPADGTTDAWTQRMFKEWRCDKAWLEYQGEDGVSHRLCDFHADAHSVIQRSMPIDFSEKGLEVVVMEHGPNPEMYQGIDLKDKLLLIQDDFNAYLKWAIGEKGAAGILSDRAVCFPGVRDRNDLYDGRTYQSFWYLGGQSEIRSSGFMLSPRQGDLLRSLAKKQWSLHQQDNKQPPYIKVFGEIESALYNGEMEVVEATLEGSSKEEIIITAHLCHPKTSANDNASGVAGGMELMTVLKQLCDAGKIQLNRTIKLLLLPEMTGTYAYLAQREKELSEMLCGINLDMIGGSQADNFVPITLTALPNAAKSIVEDVAFYCMDYVAKDGKSFGGSDISYYHYEKVGYSGGSDHYILSDPTVGVPTLMLGQWPDKFYHNALDTVDKIDPQVLKRSISIALCFTYAMSNISHEEFPFLLSRRRESFLKMASEICTKATESHEDPALTEERLLHLWEGSAVALEDTNRFLPFSQHTEIKKLIADERRFQRSFIKELSSRHNRMVSKGAGIGLNLPETEWNRLVPKRVYRGPLRYDRIFATLPISLAEKYKPHRTALLEMGEAADIALFWTNGTRNLEEIVKKTYLDCGYQHLENIIVLFRFLEECGYIRFR